MAGGEQTGGDGDCAVFAGTVGGGDCGGSEGVVNGTGRNYLITYLLKNSFYFIENKSQTKWSFIENYKIFRHKSAWTLQL